MKSSKIIACMMLLCIAILSSNIAFAGFSAVIEPESEDSNHIYKEEIAYFDLTITNGNSVDEAFLIYTLDSNWILTTGSNSVVVPKESKKIFRLSVDPTSKIDKSGIYELSVNIKSTRTKEVVAIQEEELVKSDAHRQFQPAVSIVPKIGVSNVVDSRKEIPVNVRLINRNALDIEKLNIFVESDLFQKTYATALGPSEELVKILKFEIDPYTPAGEYTLTVKALYEDKTITDKRVTFEVQENKLVFERSYPEESNDKKFMYEKYSVKLENLGNIQSSEVLIYSLTKFKNVFTKTNPDAKFDNGALTFNVALNPSEVQVIEIETDFRVPFWTTLIILIIIIVTLTGYYKFRSPIIVTKKSITIAEENASTSEIKMLINIRNRTNKILENIHVIDQVPDITEIEREFSIGTLKPTKIVRNTKKGTLIKWEFPSIEGFEERIITYKIHSKLGILGDFTFPETVVKFDLPNGRTTAVRSRK
jgi:hypothetical protein